MNKKIIDVKNLNVSFPSSKNRKEVIQIVRNVDFSVFKNQIVGFIGESGSGKSVTAKSLLGINNNSITTANLADVSGENILTPDNILTTSKETWKNVRGKKVAYIPQDSLTSLNPTMKVGKQIIESMKLHGNKEEFLTQVEENKKMLKEKIEKINELILATDNKQEKRGYKRKIKQLKYDYPTTYNKLLLSEAIKLLETFGITQVHERINQFPHQFSGGMRQRVIIAMMIAAKPDLIIADEPTTALDPTVQASVMALFQDVVEKTQVSIILISHDIAVIAKACDYLYIFYAGSVVEKGTKKDIFTNPTHPYTWSLLSAIPDSAVNKKGNKLFTIEGQPPSFDNLPKGDPFSVRNPYAMKIDFQKKPPLFEISKTHSAATWLLHPSAPKTGMPEQIKELIAITTKDFKNEKNNK